MGERRAEHRHLGPVEPRRRVREPPGLDRSGTWGRTHFMAVGGTVASTLFVLGIVLFTLPPLLLNPCEHVR